MTDAPDGVRAGETTAVSPAFPPVPGRSPWVVVADGLGRPELAAQPVRMRRIFVQVIAAAAVVLVAVAVVGVFASRRVAERQSVNDAAQTTDLLAESVVQPALEDGLLTGSADRAGPAGQGRARIRPRSQSGARQGLDTGGNDHLLRRAEDRR